MFYTFVQNNSGGRTRKTPSLDRYVVVEARSADEANQIAESLGIYFDGVEGKKDCPCCGDRWDRTYEEAGTGRPSIWGDPLTDEDVRDKASELIIHYADGSILREGGLWEMQDGKQTPVLPLREGRINIKGTLSLLPKADWDYLCEEN